MFVKKTLMAVLALGLVQDAISAAVAPPHCTNKCGAAIKLSEEGERDCSERLIRTLVPVVTTTSYTTITKKVYSTNVQPLTHNTGITITETALETEYSTSFSTSTVEETSITTDTSTVVETLSVTTTVPYVIQSVTMVKRDEICGCKTKPMPTYASVCVDNGAYASACSCIGVEPKTYTKKPVTTTILKTATAYETIGATSLAVGGTATETTFETMTSLTTVVEGAEVTITQTINSQENTVTTATETVIATKTADPVPPTCKGKGFKYSVDRQDSLINGWGVGWINSIGVGIYFTMFSGGGSIMDVDSNGNIKSWYPGSDLQMKIPIGNAPYKVWFSSVQSNVAYTFPVKSVGCKVGPGPTYGLVCGADDGSSYKVAICRDPVYFEWVMYFYTDEAQLSSLNALCYSGDTLLTAKCVD